MCGEPPGQARRLVHAARNVAVAFRNPESVRRWMEVETDVPGCRGESRVRKRVPGPPREPQSAVKIISLDQLAFRGLGLRGEALRDGCNPRPGTPRNQERITAQRRSIA